jgi:hypothetical protein
MPAQRRAGSRKGRKGGRATANGRVVQPIVGRNLRIFRMLNPADNSKYVRYVPGLGNLKMIDSHLHRRKREQGFSQTDDPVELAEIAEDLRLLLAVANSNETTHMPKSSKDRAIQQSSLECYVLTVHPTSEYAKWLISLLDGTTGRIKVMAPNEHLILSYMAHLRMDGEILGVEGRCNKANSIDTSIKCISGSLIECGARPFQRTTGVRNLLKKYTDEDEVSRATAFHFEETLPELYDRVWDLKMSDNNQIFLWTRLLLTLAVIGRSSDVCFSKDAEYCPKMQNVAFPAFEDDYTDEGLPTYLDIAWENWKGRPVKHHKFLYWIRIYANPFDLRFCPVHWLLNSWDVMSESNSVNDLILPRLSAVTYQKQLTVLFDKLGVDCSSHSLRRSAAQWAGRCGASDNAVRDVGRWASWEACALYTAEGSRRCKRLISDRGVDPIRTFWFFKSSSAISTMSTLTAQADGR